MFTARSIELTGAFALTCPTDEAFVCFSPVGETRWVPGWRPELIHPPGVEWARGQIFRTREERGDAVWVITALDPREHLVEYHRIESTRYVAKVTVRCAPLTDGRANVTVTYAFVGLSDAGNTDIDAMTQADYDAKMLRWQGWIEEYLRSL